MTSLGATGRVAGAVRPRRGGADVLLRACPNAILTALALLALLFVVWFGTLAALCFLLSGLALWLRQPSRAFADLVRLWPIHVVALWCILTTFWSNEPGITLRLGVQLALTFVIAVAMATRLSARAFVRVVFLAFGTAAVASLLFGQVRGDGGGWVGIFGSKNEFAFAMSVLTLVSVALLLERRGGWTRLLALCGLGLGAFMLLMGQSAGAMVTTALSGGLGLALVALRGASASVRLLVIALAALAALAATLIAVEYRAELAAGFLGATGKDVTLTGRTELWAEAAREIRAHPLLGQGFQAVWVPGNPVAEAMWSRFDVPSGAGFNFHNTWISNAVEIGFIGVGLQLAMFLTTLALVGRWVLGAQTAASLFFAMFMIRQAVISLVEVVVYFNFNAFTILTVAALVYGLRVRAEAAAPRRRLIPASMLKGGVAAGSAPRDRAVGRAG